MQEPDGNTQVVVMAAIKDHAKSPEEIKKSVNHDHAGMGDGKEGVWTLSAVLKCLRYLEAHARVKCTKREADGAYVFRKV